VSGLRNSAPDGVDPDVGELLTALALDVLTLGLGPEGTVVPPLAEAAAAAAAACR
jgi:hypothetical protein